MPEMTQSSGLSQVADDRLCYYCNEGRCALCDGWDRTVIDGKIVEVPCAHDCHQHNKKPTQRAEPEQTTSKRRA